MSNLQKELDELKEQVQRLSRVPLSTTAKGKPTRWSLSTNAPYYKESYALHLKDIIDKFADDHEKDLLFPRATFRRTKRTLVNQFNQAWMYLVDHLDTPENKYADLRRRIKITIEPRGVRFCWKDKVEEKVEPVEVDKLSKIWKQKIEEIVEIAEEGKVYKVENLRLSKEDIDNVVEHIDGLEGFYLLDISRHNVEIVRSDNLG